MKAYEGTLPYSAFHRKMLSKRRGSCQYLYKETCLRLTPRHTQKKKKNLEKLCTVSTIAKEKKILGDGGGHSHGNEMYLTWIPYFELGVGDVSSGPGPREVWPLAWAFWPQLPLESFSWEVLRSSMDWAGHRRRDGCFIYRQHSL